MTHRTTQRTKAIKGHSIVLFVPSGSHNADHKSSTPPPPPSRYQPQTFTQQLEHKYSYLWMHRRPQTHTHTCISVCADVQAFSPTCTHFPRVRANASLRKRHQYAIIAPQLLSSRFWCLQSLARGTYEITAHSPFSHRHTLAAHNNHPLQSSREIPPFFITTPLKFGRS